MNYIAICYSNEMGQWHAKITTGDNQLIEAKTFYNSDDALYWIWHESGYNIVGLRILKRAKP